MYTLFQHKLIFSLDFILSSIFLSSEVKIGTPLDIAFGAYSCILSNVFNNRLAILLENDEMILETSSELFWKVFSFWNTDCHAENCSLVGYWNLVWLELRINQKRWRSRSSDFMNQRSNHLPVTEMGTRTNILTKLLL